MTLMVQSWCNLLGNKCGHDAAADYKYLYWPKLLTASLTDSLDRFCVKECPVAGIQAVCFQDSSSECGSASDSYDTK